MAAPWKETVVLTHGPLSRYPLPRTASSQLTYTGCNLKNQGIHGPLIINYPLPHRQGRVGWVQISALLLFVLHLLLVKRLYSPGVPILILCISTKMYLKLVKDALPLAKETLLWHWGISSMPREYSFRSMKTHKTEHGPAINGSHHWMIYMGSRVTAEFSSGLIASFSELRAGIFIYFWNSIYPPQSPQPSPPISSANWDLKCIHLKIDQERHPAG